ncbi:MAG: ATP-dependent helicase, partial [Finegoldia magna]|nr:ATP-dependent helicase [Finegoldia magna]
INYDIHWNPVRIIQRFGRIDRIGSKNKCVQLVNFWPDLTLDEYINLKARVETRMKIVDMTATGDDNVLSNEQKLDLEYRKKQLKKLQEEVVDIEEMDTGISIMDLGLNEYKFDLLDYIKNNPDIKKAPLGMNTIVQSQQDCPEGVIFVLKNRKDSINIDQKNRLHPFYIVYISQQKDIVIDHLQPKKLLDTLSLLCKNKTEIYPELINKYNIETNDSKNMTEYSELLEDAIKSIIEIKDEDELDDFLLGKEVSFLSQKIEGLDDFELISFFVIK